MSLPGLGLAGLAALVAVVGGLAVARGKARAARAISKTATFPAAPASAPGEGRAPLTLVSLNCYLIPWLAVLKLRLEGDAFGIGSCRDQALRARRIAALARQFDVVALQEVWGGASDVLERELLLAQSGASPPQQHQVVAPYSNWLGVWGSGWGFCDVVNGLGNSLKRFGGLYAASRVDIHPVWWRHHAFVHCEGEEFMNKSASLVLFDVSARWGARRRLLLINTHLFSPNPFESMEVRAKQRGEILVLLHEFFAEFGSHADTGVLIVGDFNTAFTEPSPPPPPVAPERDGNDDHHDMQAAIRTTREYRDTLQLFHARDLFLENAKSVAHACTHTYDGENNSYVSPEVKEFSARMDYILAVDSLPSCGTPLMRLEATECDLLVNPSEPWSDHWPLTCTLVPGQ